MFVIGIDPHKGSHTAAVLDESARNSSASSACVRVVGNATELVAFAARFEPRCWAIEGAVGHRRVVRAATRRRRRDSSLDVPPTLVGAGAAARRRAGSTSPTRTTPRSAAVVALRHSKLRPVVREDHSAVLRLLANRHHDLVAHRTRAICRLHTLLVSAGRRRLATPAFSDPSRGRAAAHPSRRRGRDRTSTPRASSSSPRCAHADRTSPRSRAASLPRSLRRRPPSPTCSASDRSAPRISSATAATCAASRPQVTTPATTAPHRSKHRRDRVCGTGSTRAGTAS